MKRSYLVLALRLICLARPAITQVQGGTVSGKHGQSPGDLRPLQRAQRQHRAGPERQYRLADVRRAGAEPESADRPHRTDRRILSVNPESSDDSFVIGDRARLLEDPGATRVAN